MERYEVMESLEDFAKKIGADKTQPYMQSKIVMGVGRSIRLIEEAIHQKIGNDLSTKEGKEFSKLVDKINNSY
tara:strand:+ start:167 stop:385 length:219 start_codon:yes stop_codon:yes gene_type:complete